MSGLNFLLWTIAALLIFGAVVFVVACIYGFPYAQHTAYIDINCTSDSECRRMKRYDKLHKL